MNTVTIFVWEESDWLVRKGYTYGLYKTNEVARLLEEKAEWVESFDISGWCLQFDDIETINLKELRTRLENPKKSYIEMVKVKMK